MGKIDTEDPFDPRLKELMSKIRILLAEYDAGGMVVLGSKTHTEFADIPPHWCTIKFAIEKEYLRLRLTTKTDPALANASLGHVLNMRDALMMFASQYLQRADAVEKMLKDRGHEYTHTPMREKTIHWEGKKGKA